MSVVQMRRETGSMAANDKTTKNVMPDAATEQDPRWQSVVKRDQKADSSFVYSGKSTGGD